jgi:hypothetical protein
MAVYPSIYRAKAAKVTGNSMQAYIPQVFGETLVTIVNFVGAPPTSAEMGWVTFQAGNPEFPVWMGVTAAAAAPPPGPSPGGSFVYQQTTPAMTWVVTHNLGFYPNVHIEDSAGDDVEGDIQHDSVNQLTLTFGAAFSGTAYLS